MRIFQSVSGYSSEQSITLYSSQPTVSRLKGVSDTISKWFKNLQQQKTQISTVLTLLSFNLELNDLQCWLQLQIFRAYFFKSCNIQGKESKLFSSHGCSDDENCLYFSSIFFTLIRFRSSILLSHSTRSDARVKFDSGVIFWDQSKFFCYA